MLFTASVTGSIANLNICAEKIMTTDLNININAELHTEMREYVFKIVPAPGSDRRCSTRTLSYIITIELHAPTKFVFKKVVKNYVYMSDHSNQITNVNLFIVFCNNK